MKRIEHQTFDQERALYGQTGLLLNECAFDGPADGESALKECSDIQIQNCFCNLRYPFWHNHRLTVRGSDLTASCRAALWYSDHVSIQESRLHGIKALRECSDVTILESDIRSAEFGWSVNNIVMRQCTAAGEYFMLRSENMRCDEVQLNGKYSFQYTKNAELKHCTLNTKDAFWHAENITIQNSVVRGEYLAWYSDRLTFINCKIIGTQPFCYCTNLKLIDCKMEDTDLCFEKSQVHATILSPVVSIKNPRSGIISVPSVGKVIMDDADAKGKIVLQDFPKSPIRTSGPGNSQSGGTGENRSAPARTKGNPN